MFEKPFPPKWWLHAPPRFLSRHGGSIAGGGQGLRGTTAFDGPDRSKNSRRAEYGRLNVISDGEWQWQLYIGVVNWDPDRSADTNPTIETSVKF